jgi:hypothetical protein
MALATKEPVPFDPLANEETQRLQFVLGCCQLAFNRLALEPEDDIYASDNYSPSNVAVAKMQLRIAIPSLELAVGEGLAELPCDPLGDHMARCVDSACQVCNRPKLSLVEPGVLA